MYLSEQLEKPEDGRHSSEDRGDRVWDVEDPEKQGNSWSSWNAQGKAGQAETVKQIVFYIQVDKMSVSDQIFAGSWSHPSLKEGLQLRKVLRLLRLATLVLVLLDFHL